MAMEVSISELGILRFLPFLLLGIIYSLPSESRGGRAWLKPSEAAIYCGVGIRVLRRWLKSGGLRHSVLDSGRILIKISWIDAFLESFERKNEVDKVVDEIFSD